MHLTRIQQIVQYGCRIEINKFTKKKFRAGLCCWKVLFFSNWILWNLLGKPYCLLILFNMKENIVLNVLSEESVDKTVFRWERSWRRNSLADVSGFRLLLLDCRLDDTAHQTVGELCQLRGRQGQWAGAHQGLTGRLLRCVHRYNICLRRGRASALAGTHAPQHFLHRLL